MALSTTYSRELEVVSFVEYIAAHPTVLVYKAFRYQTVFKRTCLSLCILICQGAHSVGVVVCPIVHCTHRFDGLNSRCVPRRVLDPIRRGSSRDLFRLSL